jgi:hypothetical protein
LIEFHGFAKHDLIRAHIVVIGSQRRSCFAFGGDTQTAAGGGFVIDNVAARIFLGEEKGLVPCHRHCDLAVGDGGRLVLSAETEKRFSH